jgi:hypothetical protein
MRNERITVNLVLTGHYAGKSVTLNGYFFNQGVCTIQGQYDQLGGIITYFRKCYQAFPEGSRELVEAQASFEQGGDNGNADTDANEDNGQTEKIQSNVSTQQPGFATEDANDGGHDDNPPADSAPQPNGEMVTDAEMTPDLSDKLTAAILSLDPNNDDHWTGQNLPAMAAIEAAYGSTDITRRDVEAKLPGYDRTKAKTAKGRPY